MKRILIIVGLFFYASVSCFGQEDDNGPNDKIREKMSEFIQRRMGLTKTEAERFNPVFFRYFREWKMTLQANRNDKPLLQLRIAELRIRYRNEFRDIVGERRCNQIYEHQEVFIREVRRLREEQIKRRPMRPGRMMVRKLI